MDPQSRPILTLGQAMTLQSPQVTPPQFLVLTGPGQVTVLWDGLHPALGSVSVLAGRQPRDLADRRERAVALSGWRAAEGRPSCPPTSPARSASRGCASDRPPAVAGRGSGGRARRRVPLLACTRGERPGCSARPPWRRVLVELPVAPGSYSRAWSSTSRSRSRSRTAPGTPAHDR